MRRLVVAAVVGVLALLTFARFSRRQERVLVHEHDTLRSRAAAALSAMQVEAEPVTIEHAIEAAPRALDFQLRSVVTSVSVLLLAVYLALRDGVGEADVTTIKDLALGLSMAGLAMGIGWYAGGRTTEVEEQPPAPPLPEPSVEDAPPVTREWELRRVLFPPADG